MAQKPPDLDEQGNPVKPPDLDEQGNPISDRGLGISEFKLPAQKQAQEPSFMERAGEFLQKPTLPELYPSEAMQDPNTYFGANIPGLNKIYPAGIPIPHPDLKYLYENAVRPMSSILGMLGLGVGGAEAAIQGKMARTPSLPPEEPPPPPTPPKLLGPAPSMPSFIGGPAGGGMAKINYPTNLAEPTNITPDIAARLGGIYQGGTQPTSGLGTFFNPAELREAQRLASLGFTGAEQYPGTRLSVPDLPIIDLPPQAGETTGGFAPSTRAQMPYPYNVVPERLGPRAAQTEVLGQTGLKGMDLTTPDLSSDVTFTSGGPEVTEEPFPEKPPDIYTGTGQAVDMPAVSGKTFEDALRVKIAKEGGTTEGVGRGFGETLADYKRRMAEFTKSASGELDIDRIKQLLAENQEKFKDSPWYAAVRESVDKGDIAGAMQALSGATKEPELPTTEVPPTITPSTAGKSFDERLADWVNGRKASGFAGWRNKQNFAHLDENGIQDILDYQANPNDPKYQSLSDYFKGKRAQLLATGLELGNKGDNYLPQLWQNPSNEIVKVFPKLGVKPQFAFKSIIEDYKKGIEAGLTPRFNSLSDLAGWYEKTAEKNLADRNFFKSMVQNKEISSIRDAAHPIALDPNTTPVYKTEGGDIGHVWYATPEVAQQIGNVFGSTENWFTKWSGKAKNLAMSVGVPGTAISPHGFNVLTNVGLAKPEMIPQMLKNMLMPSTGTTKINEAVMNGTVEKFVKAGMDFSSEDHVFPLREPDLPTSKVRQILDTAIEKKDNLFEKPTFGSLIPAVKIALAERAEKGYLAKGMAAEQATREAAHYANNIVGGINLKELGANPGFQKAMKTIFFAPDFSVQRPYRLAGAVSKSLMEPNNLAGKPYRDLVRNVAVAYVMGNVLNKATSGHFMVQNDPRHIFDLELGEDKDGKTIAVPFMSPLLGVGGILGEAAASVAMNRADQIPNMINNRLSPGAKVSTSLIFNRDFAGRPLFGPDTFGNERSPGEQLSNIGRAIAEPVLPHSTTAAYDFFQGNTPPEYALPQFFGLPIRRYGQTQPPE